MRNAFAGKYTFPRIPGWGKEAVHVSTDPNKSNEGTQETLQRLARDVVSDISELDPSHSKELLGIFVSEMFRSVAEQERREERRARQAEGIAAAKARGKKFGRPAKPLPENFHQVYQDWRNGKMVLREAADACGMPSATFYDKAMAYERVSGG